MSDEGRGFDPGAAEQASVGIPTGGISSKFGLFSLQERMRALGGTFKIESAPGKGTTAVLTLPVAGTSEVEVKAQTEGPTKSLSSTLASTLHPPASRVRVLLVDDHVMIRQGLRSMLEGYPEIELAGEAGDGEQAVALVDQLCPHVVVMDVNMPKVNGIEATTQIKSRHPQIVVIGLSVEAGGANEEAMIQAGVAMLLTKEAAVDELYRVIQQAMKTKG